MATATPVLITPPDHRAIPPGLFNACFVLFTINVVYFPIAWVAHGWIYEPAGLGIPTRDLGRPMKQLIEEMFNEKAGGIVLMTMHGSKGLETDNVYIIRPDLLPSPYATSEVAKKQEMCLEFVAYTRAKVGIYIDPEFNMEE